MSDFSNLPIETGYTGFLQSRINSTQTSGIIVLPLITGTISGTQRLTILNPSGIEVISFTGQSASGALTGVTRGVVTAIDGSSSAKSHGAGLTCVLSNPLQLYQDLQTAINSKVDKSGSTMTGRLLFSGTNAAPNAPTFANSTARDAAITVPVDGDLCTVGGDLQHYNGTTAQWETADTGTPTPNASTTVAGKVEIPTQAQVDAGTDTGETGALLSVLPSQLNPNSLTNAKSSLAGNDLFIIADSAASNAIKKITATNLGFISNALLTAKGSIISASAASTPAALAAGADGFVLSADSTQSTGLGYTRPNKALGVLTTPVSLTYTTTDPQTIWTIPIPAGALSTANAIKGILNFTDLDFGSGDNVTVRITYGGTVLLNSQIGTSATSDYTAIVQFTLLAAGVSSQKAFGAYDKYNASRTLIEHARLGGTAASSINSATAQNLLIQLDFTGGSIGGNNATLDQGLIELITN